MATSSIMVPGIGSVPINGVTCLDRLTLLDNEREMMMIMIMMIMTVMAIMKHLYKTNIALR